jgi:hypothetical protein
MTDKYILYGHEAKPATDLLSWGRWFEKADRTVARSEIGASAVSTVFLGRDHSFGGGAPLLFETMVFGGPLDGEEDRYSTWDEAEAGHAAMVERVKAGA